MGLAVACQPEPWVVIRDNPSKGVHVCGTLRNDESGVIELRKLGGYQLPGPDPRPRGGGGPVGRPAGKCSVKGGCIFDSDGDWGRNSSDWIGCAIVDINLIVLYPTPIRSSIIANVIPFASVTSHKALTNFDIVDDSFSSDYCSSIQAPQ